MHNGTIDDLEILNVDSGPGNFGTENMRSGVVE